MQASPRLATAACLGLLLPLVWDFSALAQEAETPVVGKRGDVVMIRGLLGYWPGCSKFKQELHAAGYDARDYPSAVPALLARQIASARGRGTMSGELCLVGYSMGADLVIQTAKHLERMGVTVDRMVLFEPTIPGKIPSNVRYCFNLYESRPMTDWLPAFRGVGVQPINPSTPVVNYNVGEQDQTLSKQNHFTMATHRRAHRVAVDQILRR